MIFEPKEDITTYELALIIAALNGPYVFIRRKKTKELLKGSIGRHFKEEEDGE